MSRTRKYNDKYQKDDGLNRGRGRARKITAKAVRREDPDLHRMGKALIAFAIAEAEAQAEQRRSADRDERTGTDLSSIEEKSA